MPNPWVYHAKHDAIDFLVFTNPELNSRFVKKLIFGCFALTSSLLGQACFGRLISVGSMNRSVAPQSAAIFHFSFFNFINAGTSSKNLTVSPEISAAIWVIPLVRNSHFACNSRLYMHA